MFLLHNSLDVTKKFRKKAVLDDVSFEIEKGEFVFIIGKSGAGKSTLLDLIMKQEEVTSGTITVEGRRVDTMKRSRVSAHRRRLGIVSSNVGLLNDRSVYDNIELAMLATGNDDGNMNARIMKLLGLVGLAGKYQSNPLELSGGEQARILLARALSVRPEILIADEPTGNLDPVTAAEIMDLLDQINLRGTTIVMVTHAKDIVDRMKKRVIAIEKGKIVRDKAVRYLAGKVEKNRA